MDATREGLLRHGVRLEWLTIGWNAIEAGAAVALGLLAGSTALVGFGLDSVIETIAGLALLVRLRGELAGADPEASEALERRALAIVAVTFFLLAAWVSWEAGSRLLLREAPEPSPGGLVLAVLSLSVMPALAFAKLRTGRLLRSRALVADGKETLACAYLSATLLLGLGLNWAWGLWWADGVAALAMVPWLLKEGREAWQAVRTGERCCG